MAGESLPFGLRDVKLTPLTTGMTLGTAVDLPTSRTFSFTESEDFESLRGDDKVVAERGLGPTVEWELESGGISLEALVVLNGGTLTTTGTGSTTVKSYKKKVTDAKPRFQVEGQAISENGGDFHIVIYNCKASGGVEGELADGAFFLTSASGTGIGATDDDDLYSMIQNASVTAIDDGS